MVLLLVNACCGRGSSFDFAETLFVRLDELVEEACVALGGGVVHDSAAVDVEKHVGCGVFGGALGVGVGDDDVDAEVEDEFLGGGFVSEGVSVGGTCVVVLDTHADLLGGGAFAHEFMISWAVWWAGSDSCCWLGMRRELGCMNKIGRRIRG